MSRSRATSFLATIVLGAIVANAVGLIAFKLVHRLCVIWSKGIDACVTVGKVQPFIVMHAHLVPVLASAFLFFVISCRIGRVREPTMAALGILTYSAVSWSMTHFTWVAPQEAMAVVFAGACALVYFHWRQNRRSPNNALHATRENARA
jgi:predicted tellurium resistance membrane protein TerC